jgi:UDP-N-acetyl-D-mannosaminuronic acid dehydrogenase
MICEKLDINVWELISLANRHPRVNILQPGAGVGGHCIAVDPWFIVSSVPNTAKLIRTARQVNDYKPLHIVKKIKAKADRLKNPVIACLGLSFKANIDDIRQSPAIAIVKQLSEEQVGKLLVVEPYLSELPPSLAKIGDIEFLDLETAIHCADIIVLLVDHRAFQFVHKDQLQEKIVIDTRGMWR